MIVKFKYMIILWFLSVFKKNVINALFKDNKGVITVIYVCTYNVNDFLEIVHLLLLETYLLGSSLYFLCYDHPF